MSEGSVAYSGPFDPHFFEGKTIEGLGPQLQGSHNSAFRTLLKLLKYPEKPRILEVGGATGEHTTTHLLDCFSSEIDILEIDKERAEALQIKFDKDPRSLGRVHLHNMDALNFESSELFDILVLDLPTGMIPEQFTQFLPKMDRLVRSGGRVFLYLIYDFEAAYNVESLPSTRPQEMEEFMRSYFGSNKLTLDLVQRVMWPKGYAALALLDRWNLNGLRKGIGELCVEKLPR